MLHGMHILQSELLVRMRGKFELLHKLLLFIRVGWHFKFELLCMNVESAVSKKLHGSFIVDGYNLALIIVVLNG